MRSRRALLLAVLVAGGSSRCDCGADLFFEPPGSPCSDTHACAPDLTCCHDTIPWEARPVCVESESLCVLVDYGEPCVVDDDCMWPFWCNRADHVCAESPFLSDGGVAGGADGTADTRGDGAGDAETPAGGGADADSDGGGGTDADTPDV